MLLQQTITIFTFMLHGFILNDCFLFVCGIEVSVTEAVVECGSVVPKSQVMVCVCVCRSVECSVGQVCQYQT